MSQAESQDFGHLARTIRVLQNHVGMDNAISAKQLADRLGSNPSTVRNWIEDLRQQGWPIGSKNGYGYFLIDSDDEFRDVMASMEHRRRSAAETMEALASAYYGQGQPLYYGLGGGDGE